jgi:hypothetical protein
MGHQPQRPPIGRALPGAAASAPGRAAALGLAASALGVAASALGLAGFAGPAAAQSGLGPAALADAGWTCFKPPVSFNRYVHCAPPDTFESAVQNGLPSIRLLTFNTFDVSALDAELLGTERMIRADLYAGQPCPTDPPSVGYTYLNVDPFYLDYYICHTFDSPW